MSAYDAFLHSKSQLGGNYGFKPTFLPDWLFDFQASLVDWSINKGRSAVLADCGMGKTPMQLVWAQNVIEHENRPVLIVAPLSVSQQTVEEAEKFGIDARRSMDGKFSGSRIVVTNYERLHYFDPDDFAAMVCDESSIIKNFDGTRKTEVTEFMRRMKYRMLCTATAAPNDYIELGTSSEALGYLGYMDMLSMFFKNDEDSLHPAFIGSKWRFKMHAERDFWRWMASWARACRKPSDLGFPDGKFILPPLVEGEIVVDSPLANGSMFQSEAKTLSEQREDTAATIRARCESAAEWVSGKPVSVSWCNLNAEADLLTEIIPGAVQVSGSDPDERKEEVFQDFRHGRLTRLVTKPKIAAFGMNWQHCADMSYFVTHSYEQYYQAVRRFWRFGQDRTVNVAAITTSRQVGVAASTRRKADACNVMFDQLVREMTNAIGIDRAQEFTKKERMPKWL